MNILHIDSSPFIEGSVSRELSGMIVKAWCYAQPEARVTYLDLGINPPVHLSAAAMTAMRSGDCEELSAQTAKEIADINHAIDQLMHCDGMVIGAPMYNHSIPSNLKSWIDQVCQARRTFRYTASGVEGLVASKPVIIASSRGGIYSHQEGVAQDFQEPYLVSILSLMGMNQTEVIRAEGVGLSPTARMDAIAQAAGLIACRFNSR